jgi:uncharacterized protein
MVSQELIDDIREKYRLDWHGIHGVAHWTRVHNIGIKLAHSTGANIKVVEAFAFLHDSCRYSDGIDSEHGPRAAVYANSINGKLIHLDDLELSELMDACRYHTTGAVEGFDATVLTCWDSDRLDLGRIGILPNPEFLCTEIARTNEMIQWAYRNSIKATQR